MSTAGTNENMLLNNTLVSFLKTSAANIIIMIKQFVALQILMLLLNVFAYSQQLSSDKAFQVQIEALGPASLLSVNID